MAPLLLELSELEIEPLEVIIPEPGLEQDNSLETLTISGQHGKAIAIATDPVPVAECPCCGCTCCCCSLVFPCCCCL